MADYTKACNDAIAAVAQDIHSVQDNSYSPGPWPFPKNEPVAKEPAVKMTGKKINIASGEDAGTECPSWLHEGELTC